MENRLPVLPTLSELRKFRMAILKQYHNPKAGYSLAFFAKAFKVTRRSIAYDWHEIQQGNNNGTNNISGS